MVRNITTKLSFLAAQVDTVKSVAAVRPMLEGRGVDYLPGPGGEVTKWGAIVCVDHSRAASNAHITDISAALPVPRADPTHWHAEKGCYMCKKPLSEMMLATDFLCTDAPQYVAGRRIIEKILNNDGPIMGLLVLQRIEHIDIAPFREVCMLTFRLTRVM